MHEREADVARRARERHDRRRTRAGRGRARARRDRRRARPRRRAAPTRARRGPSASRGAPFVLGRRVERRARLPKRREPVGRRASRPGAESNSAVARERQRLEAVVRRRERRAVDDDAALPPRVVRRVAVGPGREHGDHARRGRVVGQSTEAVQPRRRARLVGARLEPQVDAPRVERDEAHDGRPARRRRGEGALGKRRRRSAALFREPWRRRTHPREAAFGGAVRRPASPAHRPAERARASKRVAPLRRRAAAGPPPPRRLGTSARAHAEDIARDPREDRDHGGTSATTLCARARNGSRSPVSSAFVDRRSAAGTASRPSASTCRSPSISSFMASGGGSAGTRSRRCASRRACCPCARQRAMLSANSRRSATTTCVGGTVEIQHGDALQWRRRRGS